MALEVLMVDKNVICDIYKTFLGDYGYNVDSTNNDKEAREMIDKGSYEAMIIEPFERGQPLTPHAPRVGLIRQAREKGSKVIISTTQLESDLMLLWGLIKDFDYNACFEKPYDFNDFIEPFNKLLRVRPQ